MGTKIGMVKIFSKLQKLWQNRRRAMEFEWNIFPGFNTLQLSEEVKRLLLRLDETPENFTGRIIFMSMFNDISCGSIDNEKECVRERWDPSSGMTRELCKMEEKRPVLGRSILILFKRNLFLQKERGDPLRRKQCVIQARSSEDSKDPNVD